MPIFFVALNTIVALSAISILGYLWLQYVWGLPPYQKRMVWGTLLGALLLGSWVYSSDAPSLPDVPSRVQSISSQTLSSWIQSDNPPLLVDSRFWRPNLRLMGPYVQNLQLSLEGGYANFSTEIPERIVVICHHGNFIAKTVAQDLLETLNDADSYEYYFVEGGVQGAWNSELRHQLFIRSIPLSTAQLWESTQQVQLQHHYPNHPEKTLKAFEQQTDLAQQPLGLVFKNEQQLQRFLQYAQKPLLSENLFIVVREPFSQEGTPEWVFMIDTYEWMEQGLTSLASTLLPVSHVLQSYLGASGWELWWLGQLLFWGALGMIAWKRGLLVKPKDLLLWGERFLLVAFFFIEALLRSHYISLDFSAMIYAFEDQVIFASMLVTFLFLLCRELLFKQSVLTAILKSFPKVLLGFMLILPVSWLTIQVFVWQWGLLHLGVLALIWLQKQQRQNPKWIYFSGRNTPTHWTVWTYDSEKPGLFRLQNEHQTYGVGIFSKQVWIRQNQQWVACKEIPFPIAYLLNKLLPVRAWFSQELQISLNANFDVTQVQLWEPPATTDISHLANHQELFRKWHLWQHQSRVLPSFYALESESDQESSPLWQHLLLSRYAPGGAHIKALRQIGKVIPWGQGFEDQVCIFSEQLFFHTPQSTPQKPWWHGLQQRLERRNQQHLQQTLLSNQQAWIQKVDRWCGWNTYEMKAWHVRYLSYQLTHSLAQWQETLRLLLHQSYEHPVKIPTNLSRSHWEEYQSWNHQKHQEWLEGLVQQTHTLFEALLQKILECFLHHPQYVFTQEQLQHSMPGEWWRALLSPKAYHELWQTRVSPSASSSSSTQKLPSTLTLIDFEEGWQTASSNTQVISPLVLPVLGSLNHQQLIRTESLLNWEQLHGFSGQVLVVEKGGVLSHGGITAREKKIPVIQNTNLVSTESSIKDGLLLSSGDWHEVRLPNEHWMLLESYVMNVSNASMKAKNLLEVAKQQIPIPPTLVLCQEGVADLCTPDASLDWIEQVFELFEKAGFPSLILRSASSAEDQPGSMHAGVFPSQFPLKTPQALQHALQQCEERVQSLNIPSARVDWMIQPWIQSSMYGVLFTQDPLNSQKTQMRLEASSMAEGVTGGHAVECHWVLDAKTGEVLEFQTSQRPHAASLSKEQLLQLFKWGKQLQSHWGCAQDIEWCVIENHVCVLQARKTDAT